MDLALRSFHVVVVILVILGWAAAAHAEDAAPPPTLPPPPAGTRTLADTPFQLVLPQGHLFGDWAAARPWLEEHGVTPAVTFVMDALGNPTGGMPRCRDKRSGGQGRPGRGTTSVILRAIG